MIVVTCDPVEILQNYQIKSFIPSIQQFIIFSVCDHTHSTFQHFIEYFSAIIRRGWIAQFVSGVNYYLNWMFWKINIKQLVGLEAIAKHIHQIAYLEAITHFGEMPITNFELALDIMVGVEQNKLLSNTHMLIAYAANIYNNFCLNINWYWLFHRSFFTRLSQQ